MTESSILWENNATGDGTTGGYAQSKIVEWMRALFAKGANLGGVSPDYLNELAVSGTSSPVAVATGAAIVYGFVYVNDASLNVTVGTPASATRIDRIVLRANWTAQTVRITRIAGTEGAGAPSLTQSAGTTWDIPLAQVSITTGGVITVTDQREWLDATGDGAIVAAKIASDAVTTAKILDANITAAKLASDAVTTVKILDANVTTAKILDANVTTAKIADNAIDDTKAGDRVPQFYRRQGGNASNWGTGGTTTYTPGAVRMQAGAASGTFLFGTAGIIITFPVAFSNVPIVLATYVDEISSLLDGETFVKVNSVSATQCNIVLLNTSGVTDSTPCLVNWLAIGPE